MSNSLLMSGLTALPFCAGSSSQEPRRGGNCPACSDATGGDVRRFSFPGWLLSSWPSEEPGPRNAWHLFPAVANNLLHQLPIEPFMSPQKVEDTTHTDATRQTCRHTAPRHVHPDCPTDRHRETRCTSPNFAGGSNSKTYHGIHHVVLSICPVFV